jgi:hypothetical protein
MNTGQIPKTRSRIKAIFGLQKEKGVAPVQNSAHTTSNQTAQLTSPSVVLFTDQIRTIERYRQAANLLEEAAKGRDDFWGAFNFPQLKGEPEDFSDSLFRDRMNTVLEARKNVVENQSAWMKCNHAMQCAFTAFSPFAKHFLAIAKEGQSVRAFPEFRLLPCVDPCIKSVWIAYRGASSADHRISLSIHIFNNVDCGQRNR